MNFKLWLEKSEVTSPNLFNTLKSISNPMVAVHFSNEDYLRPNLRPHHNDPIGIYCFPKDYVLSNGLFANSGFAKMPYVFFIEPSSNAKILNLNMSKEKAVELLTKMGIDPKIMEEDISRGRSKTPGHLFWDAIETVRNDKNKPLSKNISWNTFFKRTGYNAVYDDGQGIIHTNEPKQIVYLDRKAYKILHVLKNESDHSLVIRLANMFPDYKKRVKKGGWDNCYRIILSKNDHYTEHYIDIQMCGNPYIFVTIGGFQEKFQEHYDIKGINLEEIKTTIQDFIKNSTKEDYSKYRNDEDHKKGKDLLKEISKIYNLKQETNSLIKKKYKEKFEIHLTTYSNKISMLIRSHNFDNFYYHWDLDLDDENHLFDLDNEVSPTKAIKFLIDGIRKLTKVDEKGDFIKQYRAEDANKFLDFLEKRVFIKRHTN